MNDFLSHSFLCHYGIKGMKWGIRRYQNKDGSLTELGKKRYRRLQTGMSMYAGMGSIGDDRPEAQDLFMETRLAANGNWASPVTFRQERFRQEYLDEPDTVFDTVCHKINNYGKENGTTNNCTKCASAMVLAKQGYDFNAGRANRGYGEAFEQWFDNTDKHIYDNLQEATDQIAQSNNGDYGVIDMRNQNGGGHVFNWDRKSDGSFGVYDGQSNSAYKGDTIDDCMNQYLDDHPWFDREDTVVTRNMTNSEPKWGNMGEDSVVRINDNTVLSTPNMLTQQKELNDNWNDGWGRWYNQEEINKSGHYMYLG